MMLTALHCLRHGITFASVHDCFWTHACDVAIMNKVVNYATSDEFIEIHILTLALENRFEEYFKISMLFCRYAGNSLFNCITSQY